jgi:hypothetical protein
MAAFVTSPFHSHALASTSERRAKVRYACRLKGAWRPLGSEGIAWEALLQDVSESGINLVMDCPQKKGTILAVKLDCNHERFNRPVLVRVAHAKEEQDGLWSVGCSFTAPLKEKELFALLQIGAMNTPASTPNPTPGATTVPPPAPVAPPPPIAKKPERSKQPLHHPASDPFLLGSRSEHRRTPRRGGSSVVVNIGRPDSERPVEGWVVNRSLGGLCVCSPKNFEPDTILRIRVKRSAESAPSVEVRVRGSSTEGQRFMLHCQFIRQPSANTLMMFG